MKRAIYAIPSVGLVLTACGGGTEDIPRCGDGVVDDGETCDDGNYVDTDGCPTSCQPAACGDGFIQTGVEDCDDANTVDTDLCTNACANAQCGDGIVADEAGAGEACDDGNDVDGDACTNSCTTPICGDGSVHDQAGGIEECDGGPNCLPDCKIDPIVGAFELAVYRGTNLFDSSYQLCTSYGGYGGCYAYTPCMRDDMGPLSIDETLTAAGTYTHARTCGDVNFNESTTRMFVGSAQVIAPRVRYRITLQVDGSTQFLLDCDMNGAGGLDCNDGTGGPGAVWVFNR